MIDLIFVITILTSLLPVTMFLFIISSRKVDREVFYLGILVVFSIFTEIVLKMLAKSGVSIINFLEKMLTDASIWSGSIVKATGLYVINGEYIANIFLINLHVLFELSVFVIILLTLLNFQFFNKLIILLVLDLTLIITYSDYFRLSNIQHAVSLVAIECAIVISLVLWILYVLIIKRKIPPKQYIINLLFGIMLYVLSNIGQLVFTSTIPRVAFYYSALFSNVGNIVFFFVFLSYRRELR